MPAHIVRPDARGSYDLGAVRFSVLAASEDTGGSFSMLEFAGGEGPWTVPHMHHAMEESFYVLEGEFVFMLDDGEVAVGPGGFLVVPRGTAHMMSAGKGGGRLLTLATPGGLEAMFKELATLPAGSITDPEVRARIASRYDSKPVSPASAS